MPSSSNIDQLLSHLSDGSLAADLVKAYTLADPAERESALRKLVDERLATLNARLSSAAD